MNTVHDLVIAIRSVPVVEYCECGQPYSKHKFWEDRVQGYTGLDCPAGSWRTDYRYSARKTTDKHIESQTAIAEEWIQSHAARL